jgi:arginyl-tRNA synthetase
MNILDIIQDGVAKGVKELYDHDIDPSSVNLSGTRKEFEGDYTVVVFPFTKAAKKKPDVIGEELGNYLTQNIGQLVRFNVIKGFLNLVVSDDYWTGFLQDIAQQEQYGQHQPNGKKVMVEFSSPNTNKPLHLGHIRNILLGWSTSRILEAAGYEVVRVQIVNDRGIAICKSMLAWQKFGEGATPESMGKKSDHFVGHFYVLFEQKFKEEYTTWQASEEGQKVFAEKQKKDQDQTAFFKAYKNTYFNEYSALGQEAKSMLLQWEAGDEATIALWKKMNNWVYQGFDVTYENLGVHFDKLYYESNTYLLGKETVLNGLENSTFYKKEDGSVWIDLEDAKLDHKLVLRSDGTSVYMTQDIGTAQLRYQDYGVDKMVYVVADEQDYHFKVLFEILKRLGEPYADGLHHLSYGMVDLPSGKMKSREGTVVDADDLMAEVKEEARMNSGERGTIIDLPKEEQDDIIRKIGLAALKYFIVRVNPQKRMTFDPKESVDMQGQTGPYIQNAFVRIQSVLRKAGEIDFAKAKDYTTLQPQEKDIILQLFEFPNIIEQAANDYDPSHVGAYCYNLAKLYHKFWHDLPMLKAETEAAKVFRLMLSTQLAKTLQFGMDLLGIEMPHKM